MVKYYNNKKTKILKPLNVDENVLFKLVANGPWIKGKIIQIGKFPRSYIVESENGGRYRRNRKHLRTSALTTSKTNNHGIMSQSISNLAPNTKYSSWGRKIAPPKRFDL